MTVGPNIAAIASLIGEPTRAKMMIALMGGKALTASELALEAEITSSTASSHLFKLVESQLLIVRKQGRHKYFQLNGREIAELLETLLNISSKVEYSNVVTGPKNSNLRKARVCYDHLAGELGVSLLTALKERGYIYSQTGNLILSASGNSFFIDIGVDLEQLSKQRRPLCKACLDWSERRSHLAGTLGQWILNDLFRRKWAKKDMDSRVILFSENGLRQFRKLYDVSNKL